MRLRRRSNPSALPNHEAMRLQAEDASQNGPVYRRLSDAELAAIAAWLPRSVGRETGRL